MFGLPEEPRVSRHATDLLASITKDFQFSFKAGNLYGTTDCGTLRHGSVTSLPEASPQIAFSE
jgi:hypothetical protein